MYENRMKIQIFLIGFLFFLPAGCGEKDSTVENEPASETASLDCPSEWTEDGSVWLDPSLCIAWSSRSEVLTWEEANDYCSSLSESGFTAWKLPTIEQLRDLSVRNHPFTEQEGDLWSSTLDQTGLVETANLEQPGMTILLDKSAAAFAYCVFQ